MNFTLYIHDNEAVKREEDDPKIAIVFSYPIHIELEDNFMQYLRIITISQTVAKLFGDNWQNIIMKKHYFAILTDERYTIVFDFTTSPSTHHSAIDIICKQFVNVIEFLYQSLSNLCDKLQSKQDNFVCTVESFFEHFKEDKMLSVELQYCKNKLNNLVSIIQNQKEVVYCCVINDGRIMRTTSSNDLTLYVTIIISNLMKQKRLKQKLDSSWVPVFLKKEIFYELSQKRRLNIRKFSESMLPMDYTQPDLLYEEINLPSSSSDSESYLTMATDSRQDLSRGQDHEIKFSSDVDDIQSQSNSSMRLPDDYFTAGSDLNDFFDKNPCCYETSSKMPIGEVEPKFSEHVKSHQPSELEQIDSTYESDELVSTSAIRVYTEVMWLGEKLHVAAISTSRVHSVLELVKEFSSVMNWIQEDATNHNISEH